MVESAALLVDEVLPAVPLRQWLLSAPYALRFLFATNPTAMGEALSIVFRAITGFMIGKAKLTRREGQCGAVTLIQREGERSKPWDSDRYLERIELFVSERSSRLRDEAKGPLLQLTVQIGHSQQCEVMRAKVRPSHLLFLRHSDADHLVHRRFGNSAADR